MTCFFFKKVSIETKIYNHFNSQRRPPAPPLQDLAGDFQPEVRSSHLRCSCTLGLSWRSHNHSKPNSDLNQTTSISTLAQKSNIEFNFIYISSWRSSLQKIMFVICLLWFTIHHYAPRIHRLGTAFDAKTPRKTAQMAMKPWMLLWKSSGNHFDSKASQVSSAVVFYNLPYLETSQDFSSKVVQVL